MLSPRDEQGEGYIYKMSTIKDQEDKALLETEIKSSHRTGTNIWKN